MLQICEFCQNVCKDITCQLKIILETQCELGFLSSIYKILESLKPLYVQILIFGQIYLELLQEVVKCCLSVSLVGQSQILHD